MRPRQLPGRWLFADERLGDALWPVLRSLPRGTGMIVLLEDVEGRPKLLRRIRRIARPRRLTVVDGAGGEVGRVHDSRELLRALARRTPILFLSPLYETRSHPGRRPLPRMRAATLARLAGQPVFALGGMNDESYRSVRPLGFSGWGGIDAWISRRGPSRE